MIGRQDRDQRSLMVPGSMDDFIPDDHILKRVDKVLDLRWLRKEVSGVYNEDMGRPGIDPEAAVRLMLAGFFQGIVHDRKLMREAQVNLAIRWFAGYDLLERLPDHSSLTRIRQRWGSELFGRIFRRTVKACMDAGLVSGETVHVDATLIRADVSWESIASSYMSETFKANVEEECRASKKRSATDPDATMTTSRKDIRMEPSYKQHTAVDGKAGVIVDVETTTGESSEGKNLSNVVSRVEDTTGRKIERLTADGGYAHPANYKALEERGTEAIIPPQQVGRSRNEVPQRMFKYDEKNDVVVCPKGRKLTNRGRTKNGCVYRASKRTCGACSWREKCVPPSAKSRTILIVEGYSSLLRARRRRPNWDAATKKLYDRHRGLVEGIHGESKTQHGLRRAVRRGLWNVTIQVYLTAAAINLKRLATRISPIFRFLFVLFAFEKTKKHRTILDTFIYRYCSLMKSIYA